MNLIKDAKERIESRAANSTCEASLISAAKADPAEFALSAAYTILCKREDEDIVVYALINAADKIKELYALMPSIARPALLIMQCTPDEAMKTLTGICQEKDKRIAELEEKLKDVEKK